MNTAAEVAAQMAGYQIALRRRASDPLKVALDKLLIRACRMMQLREFKSLSHRKKVQRQFRAFDPITPLQIVVSGFGSSRS